VGGSPSRNKEYQHLQHSFFVLQGRDHTSVWHWNMTVITACYQHQCCIFHQLLQCGKWSHTMRLASNVEPIRLFASTCLLTEKPCSTDAWPSEINKTFSTTTHSFPRTIQVLLKDFPAPTLFSSTFKASKSGKLNSRIFKDSQGPVGIL
jgi:hypothetical protein